MLLVGVDRGTLRTWEQMLFLSVLFHHSNLELPMEFERRLQTVFVTPRMHGIHHSTRGDEMNATYSSLLSWWDGLHGSPRLDVPQSAITRGVEGRQRSEDVTLERLPTLPFRSDARLLSLRA